MRITRNRSLLALVGVALLAGLVACTPLPNAAQEAPELDSSSEEQDYDDWQLAYEKCMTGQGVEISQFLSTTGGEGGDDSAPQMPSESEVEAMQEAQAFCADEVGEPPTREGMPTGEEVNEMALVFAKCMRAAGYDYPDPEMSANGGISAMPSGDWAPEDMDQCAVEAGFPGASG